MKKITEYLTTALKSKRIQGIVALVLIHFFPDMNINIPAIGDLQNLAIGWTGYGVLSATNAALPKLKTLVGK